jgi:hypothetical protein
MHQDLDFIWTAPPVPTCPYLDNCTAVLRGGCASCSFAHNFVNADGDLVGFIAASAIAPATSRPARRGGRRAGWNH